MTQIEAVKGGSDGDPHRERLAAGNVEVRFANLERDAAEMARLFDQPSVIEHLAAVAPSITTRPDRDIERYARRHPEFKIVRATAEAIREYYESNPSSTALVAIIDDRVVGTATIEKAGFGTTWAGLSRLVVEDEYRRRGVATALIRSGEAFAFASVEDGGLKADAIQAGVIKDVEGSSGALAAFSKVGYRVFGERPGNTRSWDNERQEFVRRDTFNIYKELDQRRSALKEYFPKEAY